MIFFQEHANPWAQPMDLSFRLLDEFGLRSLSDFRGRVVVVNLWATWCEPCRTEFIALNELHDKYERDGLMIIAVSDEDAETVAQFSGLSRLKLTIGIMDSLAAGTVTKVRPYTFILDREGKVRYKMSGEKTLSDFESAVRSLL